MAATRGSFKGKPTISLSNGTEDRYPFTFGVAKAYLILSHLEEIKRFVADHVRTVPGADRHDMREEDRMAEQAGVGSNSPGRF